MFVTAAGKVRFENDSFPLFQKTTNIISRNGHPTVMHRFDFVKSSVKRH